ncbi:serine/threonine-protein kinase [Planctomycetaceae bacterium SH139]
MDRDDSLNNPADIGDESVVIPAGFLAGNAADYLDDSSAADGEVTGLDQLTEVGKYRLIRELGSGGFGRVYLGETTDSTPTRHRKVAVKLLQTSGSAADLKRFQNELSALRSVSHPGIVSLLDSGALSPHLAYLAMEFIEGVSIDKYCDESVRDCQRIVELMIQACHAIEHAHSRGVLHCDLKPSNILVNQTGEVVITDFGLVRFFEESEEEFATVSFQLRGTPAYMAPEQLTPRVAGDATRVSMGADVFGLGATLYKLLSGRPPRAARSALSVIALTVAGDPIPQLDQTMLRRPCPASLLHVVNHSLNENPANRYAHVCQLREDLENVLALRPIRARRQSQLNRLALWMRRDPVLASTSAVAMVAVLVCALLFTAWWRVEADKRVQLRDGLRAAMATVESFQKKVHSLRPGEQLTAEARVALLESTRDQFGRFANLYPEDLALSYKHAQSSYILGEYLDIIGEDGRAIEEINKAVDGYEKLLTAGYEVEMLKFDLFQAFHKQSYIEFGIGRTAQGARSLAKASNRIENLFSENPAELNYADCYAAQLHATAKLMVDQLDSRELKQLLEETLRVAEQLRDHPDSHPGHWRHRMSARFELAKLAAREGDSAQVLAQLTLATEHAEEVLQKAPEVADFRLDLLQASSELASKAVEYEQFQIGLSALQSSETHLQWLLEHRPDLHILQAIVANRKHSRNLANNEQAINTNLQHRR